jgi:hypothetical protein
VRAHSRPDMNAAERTFAGSMRALALVLVFVGCATATEPTEDVPVEVVAAPLVPAAPSEAPPFELAVDLSPRVDPHEAEREHVREILLHACGSCHLGASSIQPSALGVFDLGEVDFAARMTDAQLEGVPGRLDGIELPPDDVAAVITYVSVLFAERKADHGCA